MSILTSRDKALFLLLGKYGLLTTSQLSRVVFPGVDHSTVLRRLRVLEQAKWIYRIRALESGELVWLLSRQGENKIALKSPMIKPNRNGVAHDVLLTEFRMSLEAMGLGENFVPEWTIRRETYNPNLRRNSERVVPDGMFSAQIWNGNLTAVALELEIHAKSHGRYERIFRKYMEQGALSLIWYIVRSYSFGKSLQRQWDRVSRLRYQTRNQLIFTVMEDFKRNPRLAPIYFMNGKSNRVEQFFKLEAADEPAQPVGSGAAEKTEAGEVKTAS